MKIALLGLAMGLVLLAGPSVAETTDDPSPSPQSLQRGCVGQVDTNCTVWVKDDPNNPDVEHAYAVRYADEGLFCKVLKADGSTPVCHNWWPFSKHPVINPGKVPYLDIPARQAAP